jgi:hypothetical protein
MVRLVDVIENMQHKTESSVYTVDTGVPVLQGTSGCTGSYEVIGRKESGTLADGVETENATLFMTS